MSFARFMELALYHPTVGYYRRDQARVGYAAGTDFFTASTSGQIFGELVAAACVRLLDRRDPGTHTFVEIGAEPNHSILSGVAHPFAAVRTLRVGEPLILTGQCIVFSNELFDAQPCTRSIFHHGAWREIGVALVGDHFIEVELPPPHGVAANAPAAGTEHYRFDQPHGATALAEKIAQQPWTGLFVAFDYGKSLLDLLENFPAGTLRAYYRHAQSNDLLGRPGEHDLTCHICWDWLTAALEANGFPVTTLDSQETFLVRHAADFIAATTTAEAARLSQRKLALLQLLHPAHLGHKFQVLHALR